MPPTQRPHPLWRVTSLPLLLFLLLPLVALVLRVPPSQIIAQVQTPQVRQAVWLSLGTTLATITLTTVLGTPVAYILARSRGRAHHLLDTLVDLPTVLPPSVAGLALLIAFGRRGLLGDILTAFDIRIAFTTLAVILAQLFVASPFYVKAAAVGFASVEEELEQAAALDGANRWQLFRFITLPLSWRALVSGMALSGARALGEFGATIIFAGNFPGRTQTMPLAIYLGFELDLEIALTLSVILILCSLLLLSIVKGLLYRESP